MVDEILRSSRKMQGMLTSLSSDVAARVEMALSAVGPIVVREARCVRETRGPGFFFATVERSGEVGPLSYVPIRTAERMKGLPHPILALARDAAEEGEVCVIVQDLVGATEFVATTLELPNEPALAR